MTCVDDGWKRRHAVFTAAVMIFRLPATELEVKDRSAYSKTRTREARATLSHKRLVKPHVHEHENMLKFQRVCPCEQSGPVLFYSDMDLAAATTTTRTRTTARRRKRPKSRGFALCSWKPALPRSTVSEARPELPSDAAAPCPASARQRCKLLLCAC
jgi:hypothetical protein